MSDAEGVSVRESLLGDNTTQVACADSDVQTCESLLSLARCVASLVLKPLE